MAVYGKTNFLIKSSHMYAHVHVPCTTSVKIHMYMSNNYYTHTINVSSRLFIEGRRGGGEGTKEMSVLSPCKLSVSSLVGVRTG